MGKFSIMDRFSDVNEQSLKGQKNWRNLARDKNKSPKITGKASEWKEDDRKGPLSDRKQQSIESTRAREDPLNTAYLGGSFQEDQNVRREELEKYQASNGTVEDGSVDKSGAYSSPDAAAVDENQMFKMDEDKNLVKTYFHNMLKYINNNDATLANDRDGDLAFFIKQMPKEEMSITFPQWIIRKRDELKNSIRDNVKKKLQRLRKEFDGVVNSVESLDDDVALINLAEKLDVNLGDARK